MPMPASDISKSDVAKPRGETNDQLAFLSSDGLVVLAGSLNPIPSRTRPLNSPAPMVLSLKTWKSRSLPGLPRTEHLFMISKSRGAALRDPRSRRGRPWRLFVFPRTHARVGLPHRAVISLQQTRNSAFACGDQAAQKDRYRRSNHVKHTINTSAPCSVPLRASQLNWKFLMRRAPRQR